MARDDDLMASINGLLTRVDELERLGASRWGSPSPAGPYGLAAPSVRLTGGNQAGITAITDITGATITFTSLGRTYLILASIVVQQATVAGVHNILLTDGAGTLIQQPGATLGIGEFTTDTLVEVSFIAAGSVTRKLRATTSAGTLVVQKNTNNPLTYAIFDVGP